MNTKTIITAATTALLLLGQASAADNYKIDPAHSSVAFSVRHMGVSNVRGDFGSFSGAVTIDAGTIKDASATIQVQSINTGMAKRDEHLRAPDFFDVAKYPEITFKTRSIEKSGEQTILIGDFTMRGVTKELRLPVVLSGPVKDPWGNTRIGLQAHAMINRKDFGLTYSKVLETGGLLVAEEVSLNIEAEGIAEVPSAPAK